METTQQIILLILSYCVWIIGAITILMSLLWVTAQVITHYWGKSEMIFLRFLCYLFFNEKRKNEKNNYYNKVHQFMQAEIREQVQKEKLDLVLANKNYSILSEQELITLLENALLENSKLAKHLLEKDKETQKLKDKVAELEDDEDEDDF